MTKDIGRAWPARSPETLALVNGFLKSAGIGFLPFPDCRARQVLDRMSGQGIAPLALPEPSGLVLSVRDSSRAMSSIRDAVTLEYLAPDGNLARRGLALHDLDPLDSELGLVFPLYDYRELALVDPSARARCRNTDGVLTRLRLRWRMPDLVAGTVIDKPMLRTTLGDFACTDLSKPPAPGPSQEMTEMMAANSMTALDYICAAYAERCIRAFNRDIGFVDVRDVPGAWVDLWDLLSRDKTWRNWANGMLEVPEGLPFDPPDPDAYEILTKINAPILERAAGNRDRRTFDFVRMFLGIKSRTACPDRKTVIQRYQKDIVKIALLKLMSTKAFVSKGVPVQYLRPASMTITASDEIELLFELKGR